MGLTGAGGGAPLTHSTQHENGGFDEIDATGLDGASGGGGGSNPVVGARVFRGTNQSIPNNTLTAISLSSEVRDDDTMWTLAPNPTRITCNTDGDFDCYVQVAWDGNATNDRTIGWYKNGVLVDSKNTGGLATDFHQQLRRTISLVAGDYVEVKVLQDSGGALDVLGGDTQTYVIVMTGDTFPVDDDLNPPAFAMFRLKTGYVGFTSQRADSTFTDGAYSEILLDDGYTDIFIVGPDDDQGFVDLYMSGDGEGYANLNAFYSPDGGSELELNGGDATLSADNDASILGSNVLLSATAKVIMASGFGVVIPVLAADPSGGNSTNGQMYYNSVSHKFKGYANGAWVALH